MVTSSCVVSCERTDLRAASGRSLDVQAASVACALVLFYFVFTSLPFLKVGFSYHHPSPPPCSVAAFIVYSLAGQYCVASDTLVIRYNLVNTESIAIH